MTIPLWIVNGLLALAYLATGGMKAFVPKSALRERGLTWTDDFPAGVVKLLGVAEIIGAVGLILPLATGILPVLSPIAAVCLAVLMIGAISVHVHRLENFAPALVLLILAVGSAVLGFLLLF